MCFILSWFKQRKNMGAIKERAPILEEKPEINLMHFGVKVRFHNHFSDFLANIRHTSSSLQLLQARNVCKHFGVFKQVELEYLLSHFD